MNINCVIIHFFHFNIFLSDISVPFPPLILMISIQNLWPALKDIEQQCVGYNEMEYNQPHQKEPLKGRTFCETLNC